MNWPIAVVIIVAISAFAKVLTARYRAMNGILEDEDGNQSKVPLPAGDVDATREVRELRERVKVLERIATSDREAKSIAAEIESLRDIPPADAATDKNS